MEFTSQAAVKSKAPGDPQDYRVLALSEGPLSSEDFAAAYRELSVGTMSFTASTAGEKAPWVTIGPFVRIEQRSIAIIRQDWTDRQDNYGRPVAAQCCLCLPDSVLVQHTPSYVNLFTNIPNQSFFLASDKELLEAPVIALKPLTDEIDEILKVIDTIGFDFCSYVAAMLLVSPVVITRGQELTVDTRLSFFDAVTSLLPYGVRSDLGVSTWMNSTSIDKIRLGFSADALPNQKRIVWLKPAPKELRSNKIADSYYHHLNKLWNDPESAKEQIISELSNKGVPLTFRNLQPFLDTLQEINWEKSVHQAVVQSRGNKEQVRKLLKTESKQKLIGRNLKDCLAFLLQEPDLEDLEILRENWDESLWVPACDSVKGLRSPVFQEEVLWSLCQLAAEKGWLDKLLESLLEVDELASVPPTVELVYRAIRQLDHYTERVRYLLLRDVKQAYEFLFVIGAQAETEQELEDVIFWLLEDDNLEKIDFELIQIALGLSPSNIAANDNIEKLAELDPHYVEKLVGVAAARAQLTNDYSNIERLASAVSGWLLSRPDSLKAAATHWREYLRLMQERSSPSPELGAQLDLIMLAMDEDPSEPLSVDRYLEEGSAETKKYGEGFTRGLFIIQVDSQEIIRRLITHLNGSWLESPEGLSNDIGLIGMLMPTVKANHVKNLLVAHVQNRVREQPALVAHESFSHGIKEHLFKWNKDQEVLDILNSAFKGSILKDSSIEEVVALYLQMLELASSPIEKRVAASFSESNYFSEVGKIESFLQILLEALQTETKSRDDAWKRTRTLEKVLLRIESEPMRQYRAKLAVNLIENLEDTVERLALVVEVLDQEHLRIIKELLDEMRGSIPSQRFFGLMRRK